MQCRPTKRTARTTALPKVRLYKDYLGDSWEEASDLHSPVLGSLGGFTGDEDFPHADALRQMALEWVLEMPAQGG